MTETATPDDIANLHLDAISAEEFVNGGADFNGTGLVTTRLDRQYPTVARIVQDAEAAAAIEITAAEAAKDQAIAAVEASGAIAFYDSFADAAAALGGLAENDVIEVFEDETALDARTRYRVEAGALVKKLELRKSTDFDFPTIAALTAAAAAGSLDPARQFFTVGGYYEAGDCTLMVYARRLVEPLHALKIPVQGGTWLEYVIQYAQVPVSHGGGQEDQDNIDAFRRTNEFIVYGGEGYFGLPAELLVDIKKSYISDTWAVLLGGSDGPFGPDFRSIRVVGGNRGYRAEAVMSSVSVIAQFRDGADPVFDRPIIAMQAARGCTVEGLGIEGELDYGAEFDFDSMTDTRILDIAQLDAFGGAGRYNPYGCVIDPWIGERQAETYADPYIPARSQPMDPWDRGPSSACGWERCEFRNMNTALAVQPGAEDANGDFTRFRFNRVERCARALSIGNSQSRNVDVHTLEMNDVHTALTNKDHGLQRGRFGGAITNISAGGFLAQFYDFSSMPILGQGTHFNGLYGETIYRMGDLRGNSSNEGSLVFQNVQVSFVATRSDAFGVPQTIFGAPDGSRTLLEIRNSQFDDVRPITIDHVNHSLHQVRTQISTRQTDVSSADVAIAHNSNLGVETPPAFPLPADIIGHKFDPDPGALDQIGMRFAWNGNFREGGRQLTIPSHVYQFKSTDDPRSLTMEKYVQPKFYNMATSLASANLVNGVLSLQFTSLDDDDAMRFGLLPGDRVWIQNAKTWFRVFNRNGVSVLAEQENNFQDTGSGKVPIAPVDLLAGTMVTVNSRIFTLSYPTWGEFVQGSNEVVAGRADGFNLYLGEDLEVGDYWTSDGSLDLIMTNGEGEITDIDPATGIITFAGNARRTQRVLMSQFIRKAAPNA